MARIWEVIERDGIFIPTVRSDDEGWIKSLCKHKHHSPQEAKKCLIKAFPSYMKHQRKS